MELASEHCPFTQFTMNSFMCHLIFISLRASVKKLQALMKKKVKKLLSEISNWNIPLKFNNTVSYVIL
jgi:hypothetical protein